MTNSEPAVEMVKIPNTAHIINLIAIPVALVLTYLTIADIESPLRIWFTLMVFLLGPGSGLTQFFRIPDAALQLGVILGLSVAIDLLVGQALLSINNISGEAGICILAGLTCIRPISLSRAPRKEWL